MAHDDNFMSRDISASEIHHEILRYTNLADMATSAEEKTAFLEEASRLREAIKNVNFSLYESGQIRSEMWHDDDGKRSRLGAPAFVCYGPNGLSTVETWYVDGKEHRIGGPAVISYYTSDDNTTMHVVKQETWYFNGKVHRDDDEPALRGYYEDGSIKGELWFLHGYIHRVGGPAMVARYENGQVEDETWYQRGQIHREERPACVKYNASGEIIEAIWYNHGMLESIVV